jgi:hypothetical protein
MTLFSKGVKAVRGLFNGNKMDVNETIETAGEVIKSGSFKEQGTERQRNDMLSDSWLSKNIRPIIVLWTMTLFTTIIVGSWFGLKTDVTQSQTIGTLLFGAVGFYFPARSLEKYIKNRAKKL